MNIYIDLVFFINFIITFMFLYFSTLFVKLAKKPKFYRLFVSSITTSMIYIVAISLELVLTSYNLLLMEVLIIISIFLAFYPVNKTVFLKLFYIIHIITISIGGFMFSLINLFNPYGLKTSDNITAKLFLSTFAVAFLVLKSLQIVISNYKSSYTTCNVQVCIRGNYIKTSGFIDTGNSLLYNDTPVSIIDVTELKGYIDNKLYLDILKGDDPYTLKNNYPSFNLVVINFNSLNNYDDVLIGILCENLQINNKIYTYQYIGLAQNIGVKKFIANSKYGGN
ncbi:MAG: sigma-E processing peptidase SpoIIGA [Lachnospirales bacterium]